ncbi:nitronate monooxygenase [Alicyclobacillus sacchari]|uniref:Probable nitronate monooxygenase n=1 Tax=Alicyclobacillus sacchari TaxID=392010 RepID=A0A4V3HEX1_9BACL|nr:nitronate monooxygenase [Alicyclobacillus sacchari]TDY50581.1 nitronate monooxygenase [Alicyclobacillus sacchari]TDY50589.1 nitronate monooxygenase [Alicyclobacillus sacchari]
MQTTFTQRVGISLPIVQAGMAGVTTPEMVAAAANSGALGTIGGGYLSPNALQTQIRQVKSRTDRPFAVNLFIPQDNAPHVPDLTPLREILNPIRHRLGLDPLPEAVPEPPSFEEQMEVVFDEAVPVFSFTFGIPTPAVMDACSKQGIATIGTATTVEEAIEIERAGASAVVVQGAEAGGHRGTFLPYAEQPLIGTFALIPQVADAISIPVIAAGGIMDGRGLAAALALGAAGVQMGTAFLASPESGAHPLYQKRVKEGVETDTQMTRAYSGKPARGIRTRFMEALSTQNTTIAPYPMQHYLTQDIRKRAADLGMTDYMSMWAGQGLRLATDRSVAEIIVDVMQEAQQVLRSLSNL